MTPEQRQELLRIIEKGEEISPEWARILFPPEKREYELVYHGKDAVIIANRMLPARAEERGIKLRKSFEGGGWLTTRASMFTTGRTRQTRRNHQTDLRDCDAVAHARETNTWLAP